MAGRGRPMVALAAATALVAALAAPVAADPIGPAPVPADELAQRCGLDPGQMRAADLLLTTNAYVVLRRGELCWQGGLPVGHEVPLPVFSVTKTFGAVLVGAVAARSSLDDTTPLTEWLEVDELGEVNPDATVAHVLAMTATDPDLSAGQREPWTYDTFGDREIDLLVTVMDRVIAAEPAGFGGARDAVEFAQQGLFDRLGMDDTSWPGDSIAAGMVSTPLDLARLGELLLRRGAWDGEVVLEERFAYRMTHPSFEDANTGYGYLTYLNAHDNWSYSTGTPDDRCMPYTVWPSYPHAPFFEQPDDHGGSPFAEPQTFDIGVVWASGAGGQRLVVHRGLDLVMAVRDSVVSTDPADPGLFEGHRSAWTAIRPALVTHDPVFDGDEDAFCDAYRRGEHAPDLAEPWSAAATGGAALAAPSGSPGGAAADDAPDHGDDPAAGTRHPDDPSPTDGATDAADRAATTSPAAATTPLPVTGGGPGALALLLLAAAGMSRTGLQLRTRR